MMIPSNYEINVAKLQTKPVNYHAPKGTWLVKATS